MIIKLHVYCFYIGFLWKQNHLINDNGWTIDPYQRLTICFAEAVILYHSLYFKAISISVAIRRRRKAFIYHKFIHTHNLLYYHKAGDQASF